MIDAKLRWAEVLSKYREQGIELTPQMLRILRGSVGGHDMNHGELDGLTGQQEILAPPDL